MYRKLTFCCIGVLSAWLLLAAWWGALQPVLVAPPIPPEIDTTAAVGALKEVEQDIAAVEALAGVSVVDAEGKTELGGLPAHLKAAGGAANDLRLFVQLVHRIAEDEIGDLDQWKANLTRLESDLTLSERQFKSSEGKTAVTRLRRMVDSRIYYVALIEDWEKAVQQSTDLLIQADKAARAGDWQQVDEVGRNHRQLKEGLPARTDAVRIPEKRGNPEARTGDRLQRVQQQFAEQSYTLEILQRHVAFWQDATTLPAQGNAVNRYDAIDQLLTTHQDVLEVPGRTPSQIRRTVLLWAHESSQALAQKLQREHAALAAQIKRDEFLRQLPESHLTRLQKAADLVMNYPSEEMRLEFEPLARKWIEEMLPVKQIAQNTARSREARIRPTNGDREQLLIGVFEEVPSDPQRYRYLKREGEYESFTLAELSGRPDRPFYVVSSERYNKHRGSLLERINSIEAWQEFARNCDKLHAEAADYMNIPVRHGWRPTVLTYNHEAENARSVTQGWGRIGRLFESTDAQRAAKSPEPSSAFAK